MATDQALRLTPQEYLAFERKARTKHEYVDGELREMTGASLPHNQIASNTNYHLQVQTRGRPFFVCQSDMRVRIPDGPYYYPDVIVAPFPPQMEDDEEDTLLNPLVIVECLSRSTRRIDLGEKLDNYRHIASLTDYLIVDQERVQVDRHFKTDGGWDLEDYSWTPDRVPLPGIDCELLLSDVYDRIFPAQ